MFWWRRQPHNLQERSFSTKRLTYRHAKCTPKNTPEFGLCAASDKCSRSAAVQRSHDFYWRAFTTAASANAADRRQRFRVLGGSIQLLFRYSVDAHQFDLWADILAFSSRCRARFIANLGAENRCIVYIAFKWNAPVSGRR